MAPNNRHAFQIILVAIALLACVLPGASGHADQAVGNDILGMMPRLFRAIPPSTGLNPGKVALGERLFHDPILSRDRTIACATCHDISAGGGDSKPLSTGIGGKSTKRNTPSVFNVGLQQYFFWDGRARSLEEQIDGPLSNPDEMAGEWPLIVKRLSQDPAYRRLFQALYNGSISQATVKDAIVQYEKSLNTPGSRFDKFLRGDYAALTSDEQRGLSHFVRLGCASCHQGVLLGANVFQRFGVYRSDHRGASPADLGRYAVTGQEEDKFVFKVPSLRNVALTAPYFHDGSAPDLPSAVQTMARVQLNKTLDELTTARIVAFLQTLTGERPARPMTSEAKR